MITPIPPVMIPTIPTSNVQPFTYKDGLSFLDRLEAIQKYINRVIIPFVNDSYNELSTELQEQINTLIEAFNSVVEQIINSSIELQDSVIAGIVNDVESQTRIILDSVYANKIDFDDLKEEVDGIDEKLDAIKLNANTVTPESFGAKGDGINDDTLAINTAIATGKTVVFAPGKSYKTMSEIVGENIDVVANGANFVVDHSGSFVYISPDITPYDAVSISKSVENIAPTGNPITVYNIVMEVPPPADWKAGDKIVIGANDVQQFSRDSNSNATEQNRSGAFLTLVSVSGTTIKCSGIIDDPTTSRIRVGKMPNNKFSWVGGTIDYTLEAFAGNAYTFFLSSLVTPTVKGVTFKRVKSGAIILRNCLHWVIDSVKVLYGVNNSDTAKFGYGVVNIASSYGILSRSYFANVRHGYTNGGNFVTTSESSLAKYGRPGDNLIVDCIADSCTGSSFDTHTQSIRDRFVNCTAKNSQFGFGIRGIYNEVISCSAISCDVGVRFFSEGTGGDVKGGKVDGLSLTNVRTAVDLNVNKGTAGINYNKKDVTTFLISNIYGTTTGRLFLLNNCYADIHNVDIIHNGSVSNVASFVSNSDVTFEDIKIDSRSVTAGDSFANFIFGDVASELINHSIIARNVVIKNSGVNVFTHFIKGNPLNAKVNAKNITFYNAPTENFMQNNFTKVTLYENEWV